MVATSKIILYSIFLLILVFLLQQNSYAWLEGFKYRRPLLIDALNITENLTNYKLKVQINTNELINENKLKPDCSDIRIFDELNEKLVNYWIENECGSDNTIIWINVPFINAKTINNLYYLYYGNNDADNLSNKSLVCPGGIHQDVENNIACWEYYEDFSTDIFNSSFWTKSESNPPIHVNLAEGYLILPNETTQCLWQSPYIDDWVKFDYGENIINFTYVPDVAIEWRVLASSISGCNYLLGSLGFVNSSGDVYDLIVTYLPGNEYGWRIYGNFTRIQYPEPVDGNWVRIRTLFNSTHEFLYVNVTDGNKLQFVGFSKNPYNLIENGIRGLWFRQNWDILMKIDWVGIRKYTYPEPIVILGEEETFNQTSEKPVFIVDNNWKNILSLSTIKKPIIVSDEIDDSIINFISLYKPDKIYIVGNVSGNLENSIRIRDYNEVYQKFFNGTKGVFAGYNDSEKGKVIRASLIANLLNKPIVFNSSLADINLRSKNVSEIEKMYLNLVKEIDYLIVSNYNPLSSIIASHKNAFIVLTTAKNSSKVFEDILEKVSLLSSKGLYISNPNYVFNSSYLLLMDDIKSFNFKDFNSDLEYGDFNKDGIIDVAVGRLPNDNKIASLMIARSFLEDNKKALVASEYLYTNPVYIHFNGGGGMLIGKRAADKLESLGYKVERLVERRFNLDLFLKNFSKSEISEFLKKLEKIREKVEKIFGKILSFIIYVFMIELKGITLAEQILESFYEFDWKTLKIDFSKIIGIIEDGNVTEEEIFDLVKSSWPEPWTELNKENLIKSIPNKDVLHYIGHSNQTFWILPTRINTSFGITDYETWKSFIYNFRYNGSEVFSKEDVPYNSLKIVFDYSPKSALNEIKTEFLKKGARNYIASSWIFNPKALESLYLSIMRKDFYLGKALVDELNNRFLKLTHGKYFKSIFIFGDPQQFKDPEIDIENLEKTINCKNLICELNLTININYTVENDSIIVENADDYLIIDNEPLIPIKDFEYYVAFNTTLINYSIKMENETFYNIDLPISINPFLELNKSENSNDIFPNYTHIIKLNNTIDNRTILFLSFPTIFYNKTNKTATVVKSIKFLAYFSSPMEFFIENNKIYNFTQTISFPIKIFSSFEDNGTIFIQVYNQTNIFSYEYNISIKIGGNTFLFNFTPEVPGKYSIKVLLLKQDPLLVGPKEESFEIKAFEEKTCIPKIRINEIMYNPKGSDSDREWVEIFNYGNCSINISGFYFFSAGTNHKLKTNENNYILNPNSFAIISNNATKFREEYGNLNCNIIEASFYLRNTNDTISIKDSAKNILDEVFYSKNFGAYGNGKSLELKKDGSWKESIEDGGTPCRENGETKILQQISEGAKSVSSTSPTPIKYSSVENKTEKIVLNETETRKEKLIENKTSEEETKKEKITALPIKVESKPSILEYLQKNLEKIVIGTIISLLVFLVLRFFIFK